MLQLQIIGNLGADAQVQDFNGKKAVCFNVAHTDRWVDDNNTKHETTTWVSCILNGDGGNLLQYLKKGTSVCCLGDCSTRVYSSPKERRMVAGLNLRVNHIELIGGRVDDVPRQLVTAEGLIIQTNKAFWIAQDAVKSLGIGKGKTILLNDTSATRQFEVNSDGWVRPVNNEPTTDEVY